MNPSKGPRRRVHLRLPLLLVQALEKERDARRLAGASRNVGIPDLVEEAVALRHDRDAEVADLRRRLRDLEDLVAALRGLANQAARANRKRDARRAAKAAARRPTPDDAFRRDHALGLHAQAPLAGFCPACPQVPAARQVAPPGPLGAAPGPIHAQGPQSRQ